MGGFVAKNQVVAGVACGDVMIAEYESRKKKIAIDAWRPKMGIYC